MRIALLSALADPPGIGASGGGRPAFARFAGKTALAHQIDCAVHLGCERVLCLSSGAPTDIAATRGYAVRAGIRFDAIDSLPHLIAQVTAADEVVLIADGILPDRRALVAGLAGASAVLAFSAEAALPRGFERIDAGHAWGGALCTRGDIVARLGDLPPDCDLGSSLLRIALQAGARIVPLDSSLLDQGLWQRRLSGDPDRGDEHHWIARQIGLSSFAAPGKALVERIGLRLAQAAAGGRWSRLPHGIAALAVAVTVAAMVMGWLVLGLAALLVAQMSLLIAGVFDRVQQLGLPPRPDGHGPAVIRYLCDGLLIGLLGQAIVTVPGWLSWLLAAILVGLLRIGERVGPRASSALFGDRIVLVISAGAFVPAGYATIGAAAVIVGAMALVLWSIRQAKLTITAV